MSATHSVPAISCGHCQQAIEGAVATVAGVDLVHVDVSSRTVRVEGAADDAAIRAAIKQAGYEVAGVAAD